MDINRELVVCREFVMILNNYELNLNIENICVVFFKIGVGNLDLCDNR